MNSALDMVPQERMRAGPVALYDYRTPRDLLISPTLFRRGLIIGSCLSAGLPHVFRTQDPGCEVDFIALNNSAQIPATPPFPISEYDFQLIQIPLRPFLLEGAHFPLRYDAVED